MTADDRIATLARVIAAGVPSRCACCPCSERDHYVSDDGYIWCRECRNSCAVSEALRATWVPDTADWTALGLPWPCDVDAERWARVRGVLAVALLSLCAGADNGAATALASARRIAEGA